MILAVTQRISYPSTDVQLKKYPVQRILGTEKQNVKKRMSQTYKVI